MTQIITPLMQQYFAIKQRYADALVLFQVGDFYELFFDDAKVAAACLGIALTQRGTMHGEPIPLCGVPVHALDIYLAKLVRAGYKVALCDQLEEAKPGKIVERGITRILTPGTLTDEKLLDTKSASYLLSFFPHEQSWGLIFGELLTAQLFATLLPAHNKKMLESELARFFPDEILVPSTHRAHQAGFQQLGYYTSLVPECLEPFDISLLAHESQAIVQQHVPVYNAWRQLHAYVERTSPGGLAITTPLTLYAPEDFLLLDAATQRNLELVKNMRDGGKEHTLFHVLDRAATPMGSRTIKKWIMRPLVNAAAIEDRHTAVSYYTHDRVQAQECEKFLKHIGDLERVVGRIALRRAQLHDYKTLKTALAQLPSLASVLHNHPVPIIQGLAHALGDFSALHDLLARALNDDAQHDGVIKRGFDARLDAMRDLVDHGAQKIIDLERIEQQATGISSLKIRYNTIHGYYLEVTKTHYDAIPERYIRRQTLVGRERFVTQELQLLEQEMASARRDITQHEQALFDELVRAVSGHVAPLRKSAYALAHLDALVGFAHAAYQYGYVRPAMVRTRDVDIVQGRHPVVERVLATHFITNDMQLNDQQATLIITGPNMGGKSTYLRQGALIAIMAHSGSFVPAQAAQIPIFDRIFTRIGAGDNLAEGKSTFLVEMEETATICSQATSNSLVILDEVGRGTSTFDGLAIAQAVVEYLHTVVRPRCLFATHYHELTALQDQFPGITSYYAASRKSGDSVILLYKILKGVADGSFGLEVAKLAAMPRAVIERAEQILADLSQEPALITSKSIKNSSLQV